MTETILWFAKLYVGCCVAAWSVLTIRAALRRGRARRSERRRHRELVAMFEKQLVAHGVPERVAKVRAAGVLAMTEIDAALRPFADRKRTGRVTVHPYDGSVEVRASCPEEAAEIIAQAGEFKPVGMRQ